MNVTHPNEVPETQGSDPEDIPNCVDCPFRAKAEAKPRSFLGFLWRLHTKICPGWKKYKHWLAEQEAASSGP